MKVRFTGNSREPFALTSTGDELIPVEPPAPLPEGWRKLTTGRRDAQLYRVATGGSGSVHWVVAVLLDRRLVQRRFASELHARGWISLACGERATPAEAPAGQPEEFPIAGRRR